MKNVLIVEDHAVVRMGMNMLLHDLYPNITVQETDTFPDGLALVKENHFELIILDIMIDGSEDVRMVPMMLTISPKSNILIFSGCNEEKFALKYLQAGAHGFLPKRSTPEECKLAIKTIVNGDKYVSYEVNQQILRAVTSKVSISRIARWKNLSERELEVANLLIKGQWTSEIATTLNLKASTVSTFKRRIFDKLNVNSSTELLKVFEGDEF